MNIAVVGLGRMGFHMAKHVHAAGFEIRCFDIDAAARWRAQDAGLKVTRTINPLADADLLLTSLPATNHVEDVYGQLLPRLAAGAVATDLSTIGVESSRQLAISAAEHNVRFLDAPVSGTSIHAEAGTLVVMVGGDTGALEIARPALETFAARVDHVGDNGSGLLLKLITNRLLTTHVTAIAEAVLDLEAVGLDVEVGIEMIRSGAVPKLLDYKAGPLIHRDFTPTFTVNLMRKDLGLAAEALPASRLGDLSRTILEEAGEAGHGEADLAALITALEVTR